MKSTTCLIIAIIALCLMGCASKTIPADSSTPKQNENLKITKGKSTKQDVIKMFGTPQSKEIDGNEKEQWVYNSTISNESMWVRSPVSDEIKNSPNMNVTAETKDKGGEKLQKVIMLPKNAGREVMAKYVITFEGDIVDDFSIWHD